MQETRGGAGGGGETEPPVGLRPRIACCPGSYMSIPRRNNVKYLFTLPELRKEGSMYHSLYFSKMPLLVTILTITSSMTQAKLYHGVFHSELCGPIPAALQCRADPRREWSEPRTSRQLTKIRLIYWSLSEGTFRY